MEGPMFAPCCQCHCTYEARTVCDPVDGCHKEFVKVCDTCCSYSECS